MLFNIFTQLIFI